MRKKSKSNGASEASRKAVKAKELEEIKEQARTSADDIQFFLDCYGEGRAGLDFSIDSLFALEAKFRRLSTQKIKLTAEFPFEMLARLTGMYLGEVIVRNCNGAWDVYAGNNYTHNRIVVRIGDKFCDPLRFGMVLDQAKQAHGAWEGKALHYFATKLNSAFP